MLLARDGPAHRSSLRRSPLPLCGLSFWCFVPAAARREACPLLPFSVGGDPLAVASPLPVCLLSACPRLARPMGQLCPCKVKRIKNCRSAWIFEDACLLGPGFRGYWREFCACSFLGGWVHAGARHRRRRVCSWQLAACSGLPALRRPCLSIQAVRLRRASEQPWLRGRRSRLRFWALRPPPFFLKVLHIAKGLLTKDFWEQSRLPAIKKESREPWLQKRRFA